MAKHPIIANGEMYAEPITKTQRHGEKTPPRDYFTAKQRIITALDSLTKEIEETEEVFLDEKIVCIRLDPKYEAKSYVPISIISAMSSEQSKIVGGRKYTIETEDDEFSAKLYFVRTTDVGLQQLRTVLQSGEKDNVDTWRKQLCYVNTIDLLQPDEKVMGFAEDWEFGTAEFVLHPVPSMTQEEVASFFKYSGIDQENARVKTYDDGITFISATCTNKHLQRIKTYNPLRAVHPMGRVSIDSIRAIPGSSSPTVKTPSEKPIIRIGVFDGGADAKIPLLKEYVTEIEASTQPPSNAYLEHGSGVCSAILYGSLSGKSGLDVLEAPNVAIDCYRVFPLKDKSDHDLYEVIDTIESIVPNTQDTLLYNLSIGPRGAIVDDSINRFTYAIDRLTYQVPEEQANPLFVVAVGNDGTMPAMFNRVQAPSDIVNGLGIGAYTLTAKGGKTPAQYSCIGPGREGAKTKPDLLDFGGSFDHPFIVPSLDGKSLSATAGTSFASPMVVGKIGKLMAMSDYVTPQLGRTLMVHNAVPEESLPKDYQGFGFSPETVESVLECDDNRVTVMYSGTILPKQYVRLPIFMPRINEMSGKVQITWTVSAVVPPFANDPDAYTNNCLEDQFIPHSMKYNYTKKGSKSVTHNLLDPLQVPIVKALIDSGYKQSATPITRAGKTTWNEEDLRAVDLKWDTVIRKGTSMLSRSLFDPSLTLHAMGRNGFEDKPIRYNVAVTIEAPKYQGSLYDAILQTYQNLTPIEIRNISRLIT